MLRQGPIPPFIHGVLGYLIGLALVGAPFVLAFDSGAATAISIVIGVLVLAHEASSQLPTGIARVVPVRAHVLIDIVVSAVLIAAPFLFGFSEEGNATAFFIVVGIFGLLLTIATRFLPAREVTPPVDRAGGSAKPDA